MVWSPRAAVRAASRGLIWRSADNARHALEDIEEAVADRKALQDKGFRRISPLSTAETRELLETQSVARFAYIAREGIPDVVPVNYVYREGVVLIRSGPGPKLQAAQRGDVVALEVDELDAVTHTGRSAVVVGPASVVKPHEVPAAGDVETWAMGPRRHLIRIVPTRIEGRRLT